jgi:A/G-specific adenine glycosylase
MRELPTIEAAAKASPAKIHKLWEGLGYYTRVRNLQKAAKQITQSGKRKAESGNSVCKFPENFNEVLALPGIGRYTAGAICSIAFNQAVPILDGNVIRVLTRIFGIAENPKEKETNARLWRLAEELVAKADKGRDSALLCPDAAARRPYHCSNLNQSLMELGALVCTPRNPRCRICPVKKLCVAFQDNRVEELPNLGKREKTTARRFVAFVVERDGKCLVRQRPAGVVNAHLWEFPNDEHNGFKSTAREMFMCEFGFVPPELSPLLTVKHSITRYRITLEAFAISMKRLPPKSSGFWKTPAQMRRLAFTAAHKKLATLAVNRILSGR